MGQLVGDETPLAGVILRILTRGKRNVASECICPCVEGTRGVCGAAMTVNTNVRKVPSETWFEIGSLLGRERLTALRNCACCLVSRLTRHAFAGSTPCAFA